MVMEHTIDRGIGVAVPSHSTIRLARESDYDTVWPILRDVIRAGDTYALDTQLSRDAVRDLWMDTPRASYVVEDEDGIIGTYYIKTNQQGGGAHVCNCGYVVAPFARGRGIAEMMCLHSQDEARGLGYLAMQFNSVVETNEAAIRLWEKLGFDTVGRLPRAFQHPEQGFVDARVMYKWLGEAV
ncbi:Acetyltransferase (GNAT) family protein [Roseovarius albus]|uniref:Acetyltransferase (GNAT) family protein n=2 Tax=Roseovarius albus TaxID=1247867 RepID=A0A1X6Y5H4_9RHOB|nr:Acetyltransferase (GNAT) family protein [Roseovarius albus]